MMMCSPLDDGLLTLAASLCVDQCIRYMSMRVLCVEINVVLLSSVVAP